MLFCEEFEKKKERKNLNSILLKVLKKDRGHEERSSGFCLTEYKYTNMKMNVLNTNRA